MPVARHPLPPELVGVPLKEVLRRHVGRFRDKRPDWSAFARTQPPSSMRRSAAPGRTGPALPVRSSAPRVSGSPSRSSRTSISRVSGQGPPSIRSRSSNRNGIG